KALTELKETQQKIIQQERLRDMGQLASGITHSFNDVLTVILGLSDSALNQDEILNDKDTIRSYLEMIRNSAIDGRQLSEQLKMFYRQRDENETFTPININELIKQVILITQPRWKVQAQTEGIKIDVLTDLKDVPQVYGKENELREVLTNLIFNAIDALIKGGTIHINTKTDGGKDVIIEVIDTGIGMTEETRRRCFELYYSTKKEAGTGLGLAIAYGTIQRHNGKIEVESELGKGTKFTIRLPIATITEKKVEELKPEKHTKPLRPLNILVVDDSKPIQKVLGLYLTADGHKFELASNGKEALEKFKSGTFDLVITDRAMPDINGDKLAYYIKQIKPETPVIMITGLGNIMEASGEFPQNIDRLVSKPLTMKELHQALAETAKLC
ncbi:MAG: hybrid sensor histidine kinase/response regulator, partial [Candidatus Poribacteria bacterium]